MSSITAYPSSTLRKLNSEQRLSKTPTLHPRVTHLLSNVNSNQKLDLIKAQNTYEYFFYVRRRQEYQQKQLQLVQHLLEDGYEPERALQCTYSVKQVGVSEDHDMRFGIQSQRRFIQSEQKKKRVQSDVQHIPQQERVMYGFRAKRLRTGKKEERELPQKQDIWSLEVKPQRAQSSMLNKKPFFDKLLHIKKIDQIKSTTPMTNLLTTARTSNDEKDRESYSRMVSRLSNRKSQQLKQADHPMMQIYQKLETNFAK